MSSVHSLQLFLRQGMSSARLIKPQLAHAIIDHSAKVSSDAISESIPKTEHYVLDGGSLLHRLPWNRGDSYGKIAQSYADFTIRQQSYLMVFMEVHPLKTVHTKGADRIPIQLLASLQKQSSQDKGMIFSHEIAISKD